MNGVARLGDALHRRLFGLMAAMPGRASSDLLRRYFEWFHRRPDPWGHAVLDYERQKYRSTLERVPPGAYRRVLDAGCSEGTFTVRLAEAYPDAEVVGVDISERAVHRARRRAVGSPHRGLSFQALDLVTEGPAGRFDLIFCAETLYYLGRGERSRAASRRLAALLEAGGLLVLVHPWPEARALYQTLDADPALRRLVEHVEPHPQRPYAVSIYERG
jgi:trans-aconitate methyltransferase